MAKNVIVSERKKKAKNFCNKGTINGEGKWVENRGNCTRICCSQGFNLRLCIWSSWEPWIWNHFVSKILSVELPIDLPDSITSPVIEKLLGQKSQVILQQISSIAFAIFCGILQIMDTPPIPIPEHKMKPSNCKCETNCKLAAAGRWKSWKLLLKCINQNLLRCFALVFVLAFTSRGSFSKATATFPIMQRQRGNNINLFFFILFLFSLRVRVSIWFEGRSTL